MGDQIGVPCRLDVWRPHRRSADHQSTTSTLVLDEIDGHGRRSARRKGHVRTLRPNIWESMSLQSRPDGTLQGEFIVRSTTSCARNQQVTFTRTGDVAAQRVGRRPRSPAAAGGVAGPSAVRPVPGDRHLCGRRSQRRSELRHPDVLPSHRRALPELLDESRQHQDSGLRPEPVGVGEHVIGLEVQERRSRPTAKSACNTPCPSRRRIR